MSLKSWNNCDSANSLHYLIFSLLTLIISFQGSNGNAIILSLEITYSGPDKLNNWSKDFKVPCLK